MAALLTLLKWTGYLIAATLVCGVAVGIGALVAAITAFSGLFFTGLFVLIIIAAVIGEALGYGKEDPNKKSPQ